MGRVAVGSGTLRQAARQAAQAGMVVLLATVAALAAAPRAQAQIESREGITLENEILEIKQQLQQLQQLQVQAQGPQQMPQSALPPPGADNGAPPQAGGNSDITAQLLVRVGALEEQMRTLHGRVEELANAEQRDHDDLAKQISDMAFKLGRGAPGGAPGGGLPPQGGDATQPSANPDPGPAGGMDLSIATPPPAPPPTHRTAEVALKQGNAALARRDYPGAEAAAREVLALGHNPHTPDAVYLLARALAGQHEYQPAAASFFAVYKASPKSPRGAEGLLGVANAMMGLNDTKDACEAVAKFSAEFPHADAPLHQAAASLRKRAQCR